MALPEAVLLSTLSSPLKHVKSNVSYKLVITTILVIIFSCVRIQLLFNLTAYWPKVVSICNRSQSIWCIDSDPLNRFYSSPF